MLNRYLPPGSKCLRTLKSALTPLLLLSATLILATRPARADATLILEDPINFLGHLSSTGHSALLMDRLCSDDHLHMRLCHQGETGSVISRYQGIGKLDWIAMPVEPYLFATDHPTDLAAYASLASVDALRDQYRADHLTALSPDPNDDSWIQLVGAAYRRRIVLVHIRTTPQQDLRLMNWLNTRDNRSHFNFFFANCADFARQALNVLFPHAVRRNFFFDAGMTTPKQLAASLHHYAERHPGLDYRVAVLPQIPGEIPRSGHLYGVTEALLKTKPYLLPLVILQPVGIGSVIASGLCDHRYNTRDTDDFPTLKVRQAALSASDATLLPSKLSETSGAQVQTP